MFQKHYVIMEVVLRKRNGNKTSHMLQSAVEEQQVDRISVVDEKT